MDTDKRFSWRMLRDVEHEKIQHALSDAFAMNSYSDASKNRPLHRRVQRRPEEGRGCHDPVQFGRQDGVRARRRGRDGDVAGVDFMKAVWSIWFAKIDQPALGDALIKNL